ncbi:MAG: DASS family sodium-coupled anion symporter [Candidatus Thorarchaeota archaeon]
MDRRYRSLVIICVAALAGIVVYHAAPAEMQPGVYQITLNIDSPTIQVSHNFTIQFVTSGTANQVQVSFIGPATNVTLRYADMVILAPGSQMTLTVIATGDPLISSQITATIRGEGDFVRFLRPTRQTQQTFRIDYQPPARNQFASFVLVFVAILWFTEGVPLVATSLLIPVLVVLLGIGNPTSTLASYFDPAVVLILGGFMIARAIDKYELDRRLALLILAKGASSGPRLVLVVMCVGAFLSMWMSNTAAAAIMIPIALALISKIKTQDVRERYGKAIILGAAYSATLGGIGTLVGSPPNPLAAAYAKSFLGIEISFVSWLPFGLPVMIIMILFAWRWLIIRFRLPTDIAEIRELKTASEEEYRRLGPMTLQERVVTLVFSAVMLLWLTERLPDFLVSLVGWSGHGISSSIVALMGGFVLLSIGYLDEKDMSSGINWSSLLILGSGIALGEVMFTTGLSTQIAEQMQGLGVLPAPLVVIIIGTVAVLVTMIASNTGAAVILIPVAIPLATSLGIDPLLVVMTIAICVSMDFALPTGTPPSTIAYSTGHVKLREMISTGLVIDLIAILVVTVIGVTLWGLLGLVSLGYM